MSQTTGTRFGPEPHHIDPYDGMTDEELDGDVDDVFAARTAANVIVSVSLPADLLERTKRVALRTHVPYQSLIERLIMLGVTRLEQHPRS